MTTMTMTTTTTRDDDDETDSESAVPSTDESATSEPPNVFVDPSTFRQRHCYTEAVTTVLRAHLESLRHLFYAISAPIGDRGLEKKLLSLPIWLSFARAAGLVGVDLSVTDAVHCFTSSRMTVVDTSTARGVIRANHLPFEGFLEALCRAASLKGWPEAWEMNTLGFSEIVPFVEYMNQTDPSAIQADAHARITASGAQGSWVHSDWSAMRRERRVALGEEPLTPVAEGLRYMLALLRATVLAGRRTSPPFKKASKQEIAAAAAAPITRIEAIEWARAAMSVTRAPAAAP